MLFVHPKENVVHFFLKKKLLHDTNKYKWQDDDCCI